MNNSSLTTPKKNIPYSQIIQTIGEQLKYRKKSIFKKVLLTSTPLTIATVALVYSVNIKEDLHLSEEVFSAYVIVFSIMLVVAFAWAVVMGRLFRIERTIWVDSFFDEVPLTDKESWQLAKKLFWPSYLVSFLVFLRYYLILILLWITFFVTYGFLMSQGVLIFNVLLFILTLIAVPFTFVTYSFFVKVRLRYLNFVFLDNYLNPNFSYVSIFKDAVRINQATKGDVFRQTIIIMLGTEVAENAINSIAVHLINSATSQLNGAGKAAGAAAGQTVSNLNAVYRSYAQEVTFYIYYRVGRSLLEKTPQVVNESLYSLVKK